MDGCLCKKCHSETCWNAGRDTYITSCSVFVPPKPVTNYDLLIRKTPEELAKWIVEIADCDECEEMHGFRMCDAAPDKACEDCWAGWLMQEAEEGET